MADVLMPRLSDTMAEGVLSQWLKKQGDPVRKGDVLAEIETDKATMELEAYDEGVLERLLVPEGATVPIGQPIAVIGDGTHAGTAAAGGAASASSAPAPPPAEPAAWEARRRCRHRARRQRRPRRYGLLRSPGKIAREPRHRPGHHHRHRAGRPDRPGRCRGSGRRRGKRSGSYGSGLPAARAAARPPRQLRPAGRPTTRRSRSPPSGASRPAGSPRAPPHRTST